MNLFNKKFFTLDFLIYPILIIAAFLRFYRISDYMTFLGDEGRDVLTVYNILHGHLTLLGPTASVGGFFLGPIYYYFMAPFLFLFNYNPVGPAMMIALLGVATVYLVFYLGSTCFNKITGLIASFIYSISPLAIIYSRSSWNPNPMPFFTIICLLFLYYSFSNFFLDNNKSGLKFIFLSGFIYGILLQLHYIETFLGVSIFLYIILAEFLINLKNNYKETLNKNLDLYLIIIKSIIKDFLVFSFGFLIGFAPYIAFEFRHKFVNTGEIIKFIFHSSDVGSSAGFFIRIRDVFIGIFSKLIFFYPSNSQFVFYPKNENWSFILIGIVSFLAVFYFFSLLIESFKNIFLKNKITKQSRLTQAENISWFKQKYYWENKFLQYLLLFVWLVPSIIIFGFYKKNIYYYYFEFLYPVIIIIIALFITFLLNSKLNFKKEIKLFDFKVNLNYVTTWLIRISGIVFFSLILFRSIDNSPIKYGPNRQLFQTEEISKVILKEAENRPYNFALIASNNSDFAYRYFLTLWGNPPIAIEPPFADSNRTTVTKQLIVVCESIPCFPLGNPLWEIAGFGQANIVDKRSVSFIEIFKLKHFKAK